MIPSRRKPTRSGIRDNDGPLRSDGHLKWIRGHNCIVGSAYCDSRIEAAHVRIGTDGSMGKKPSDFYTVPLCAFCHHRQHVIGERTFWEQLNLDPLKIAAELWAKSPHRLKLVKPYPFCTMDGCAAAGRCLRDPLCND